MSINRIIDFQRFGKHDTYLLYATLNIRYQIILVLKFRNFKIISEDATYRVFQLLV